MKNQVAVVNGSMSVTKKAARVKKHIRQRCFMEADASRLESQQTLSGTQSPYPVGSQFVAGSFTYSAEQLSSSARTWIQSYDRFRIKNVEIFVTGTARSKNGSVDKTVPIVVYYYEDTDCNSATQTSWIRVSDRDNLGKCVLTAMAPSQKLISFTPTVSFDPNTTTSQSPANVIPPKNTWLDAVNLSQQMAGFRFFAASPQVDATGETFKFDVTFETRYTVEVCQPI
jgi:hypothetical protein